ncbi:hypothetical protein ABZV67_44175 [Streptomyces sp. NPDC005065]|uniref:hypothetical protein n=1 Tax=Streptomyces sp. NPDC005065 TaxID=3154461 RepID=UPI0033AAF635
MIFKVIGDVHPGTHFLGYVKYYPDTRGDRVLFGRTYRQNSVVSKAFGILADRPECYLYSPAMGCVITGVPREDIVTPVAATPRPPAGSRVRQAEPARPQTANTSA